MQVPVVDKIFNSAIKERYDHYQPKSPNNIGKKVLVAHETVTDFVLDAIAEINEHNDEKQMPLKKYGFNPRSKGKSLGGFQEHLNMLKKMRYLA
jgi:hypothetical protein